MKGIKTYPTSKGLEKLKELYLKEGQSDIFIENTINHCLDKGYYILQWKQPRPWYSLFLTKNIYVYKDSHKCYTSMEAYLIRTKQTIQDVERNVMGLIIREEAFEYEP